MKAYWFTIADGAAYQVHAERLRRSLKAYGVSLAILAPGSSNSMEAKRRKISGILDAPRSCDRIVYLDADTLVLDPAGIERVNGAWQIPWRIPVEGCLPKTLDLPDSAERLESFYRRHSLSAFAKGGNLEGIEWNSGVIVGNRDTMVELAREWALWWDRIQELFDGHFRRDQLSFRIAYHNVCLTRNIEGLPAEYNWIASYFGINPNAHILHRTMVRNVPWLEEGWERIVARRLAGEDVKTANRCFDYSRIATGRPCLQRRTDVDRDTEADLLCQTLAFGRPESILLCGIGEDDRRFLPLIRERTGGYACVASLDRLPTGVDLAVFDLVLFCGVDFVIREVQARAISCDTVFCFAGIHDMALYRYLYEFAYVRILDHGFGLFSHSSRIITWMYEIRANSRREVGS
jgi:hypothetical protein